MTPAHPLSAQERSALADVLQPRLASLAHHSDTRLDNRTPTQRAGAEEGEAAATNRDNRELSAVTQALLRIHCADYGLCVDCQLSIDFERLQLVPRALRCAACQTLFERTH